MTLEIHRHQQVKSTQDLLHDMAEGGAGAGTVIVAEEQVGGRGQRGKSWSSAVGGLWMSALVAPKGSAAGEVMSLRAGLAVARVLDGFSGIPRVQIKWPNDIYIDDKKVGGLLCEARWRGADLAWVAVGVGINVRNPIPPELTDQTTTLATYDPSITVEALIVPMAEALLAIGAAGATLTPEERAEFAGRHWLKGKRLSGPVRGVVGGLTADGALMVAMEEGGQMPVRSASVVVE